MKYVGKRGDYYFYTSEQRLSFFSALPEVQPDHIIAGGASVAVLMESQRIKDIDVWVAGNIPKEATRESEFAFNYRNGFKPPVQYMKVKATTPSSLLDSFDIDACKCALYNITEDGYSMVLHKFLKPLVYKSMPTGICGVNPEAYNCFSTMRFHKYAMKFKRKPLDMYLPDDYAKALKLSEFSDSSIEEITQAMKNYAGDDQYELLDHLRGLFGPFRRTTASLRFDNVREIYAPPAFPRDRMDVEELINSRTAQTFRDMWDTNIRGL